MKPAPKHDPWAAATFEGSRAAQAREAADLSFHQRLAWCCEMSEVIRKRDLREGRTPPALRPDRYGCDLREGRTPPALRPDRYGSPTKFRSATVDDLTRPGASAPRPPSGSPSS